MFESKVAFSLAARCSSGEAGILSYGLKSSGVDGLFYESSLASHRLFGNGRVVALSTWHINGYRI